MLSALPNTAFIAALARLLASQPGARLRLARHAGKRVCIRLPLFALDFVVDADGGIEAPAGDSEITTEIGVSPDLLLRLALGDTRAMTDAAISGDGVFASDLSAVLNGFDWALALRPYLGDIAAARVAWAIEGFGRWRNQVHASLGHAAAEYMAYEAPVVADKPAVRRFVAEVDELRDAAARLEARLRQLEIAKGAG